MGTDGDGCECTTGENPKALYSVVRGVEPKTSGKRLKSGGFAVSRCVPQSSIAGLSLCRLLKKKWGKTGEPRQLSVNRVLPSWRLFVRPSAWHSASLDVDSKIYKIFGIAYMLHDGHWKGAHCRLSRITFTVEFADLLNKFIVCIVECTNIVL